jgi:hypothetical protein
MPTLSEEDRGKAIAILEELRGRSLTGSRRWMGIPLGIRSWFAIVAIRKRKKSGVFGEGGLMMPGAGPAQIKLWGLEVEW